MDFPLHLLIPLGSAVAYPIAALMLKRANALGVGVWRTAFVANWLIFLQSVPLSLLLPGTGHAGPDEWWQPAIVGALFFCGQAFTFLAITVGDVSVATPLLGSKIVLVALSSAVLLPDPIPLRWWFAAIAGSAAVALLGFGKSAGRRRVGLTVLFSVGAAGSFAIADVLLQKWTPFWGANRFMPAFFLVSALLSFALIPKFSAPLRAMNAQTWRWVLSGAGLLSLQSLGIAVAVGNFGDATAVNIVYSLRGLFSIGAVWWIGHHFGAQEELVERGVLQRRLTGAFLMIVAVVLVFL